MQSTGREHALNREVNKMKYEVRYKRQCDYDVHYVIEADDYNEACELLAEVDPNELINYVDWDGDADAESEFYIW